MVRRVEIVHCCLSTNVEVFINFYIYTASSFYILYISRFFGEAGPNYKWKKKLQMGDIKLRLIIQSKWEYEGFMTKSYSYIRYLPPAAHVTCFELRTENVHLFICSIV